MNSPYFNLTNKITIITGTSRGIGYAIAKGFLESGSIVHGISRTNSDLTKEKKYTHHMIDLREKKSIIELVNKIGIYSEKIDVLINCAGETLNSNSKPMHDDSMKNILEF